MQLLGGLIAVSGGVDIRLPWGEVWQRTNSRMI